MARTIAYVLGAVLLVVGVLGFFNNPVLGFFEVDLIHNLIHLITGAVLLYAAWKSEVMAVMIAKVLGIVYALVGVLGFFAGGSILGFFAVNGADNVLHILLALILLYAGFMAKGGSMGSMGGGTGTTGGSTTM